MAEPEKLRTSITKYSAEIDKHISLATNLLEIAMSAEEPVSTRHLKLVLEHYSTMDREVYGILRELEIPIFETLEECENSNSPGHVINVKAINSYCRMKSHSMSGFVFYLGIIGRYDNILQTVDVANNVIAQDSENSPPMIANNSEFAQSAIVINNITNNYAKPQESREMMANNALLYVRQNPPSKNVGIRKYYDTYIANQPDGVDCKKLSEVIKAEGYHSHRKSEHSVWVRRNIPIPVVGDIVPIVPNTQTSGYIYVIVKAEHAAETDNIKGKYKVGRTIDPDRRLGEYGIGAVRLALMPKDNPVESERVLLINLKKDPRLTLVPPSIETFEGELKVIMQYVTDC